jgi:hypothetical protein
VESLLSAAALGEWVTLLEDDVWWLRAPDVDMFQHDINCGSIIFQSKHFTDWLKVNCPSATGILAGYGGCVMRSAAVIRAIQNKTRVKEFARQLQLANPNGDLATDSLLVSLVECTGGTVGGGSWYRNVNDPMDNLDGVFVIHQMKAFYPCRIRNGYACLLK